MRIQIIRAQPPVLLAGQMIQTRLLATLADQQRKHPTLEQLSATRSVFSSGQNDTTQNEARFISGSNKYTAQDVGNTRKHNNVSQVAELIGDQGRQPLLTVTRWAAQRR